MKRISLAFLAAWVLLVGCATVVDPDREELLSTRTAPQDYTCCETAETFPQWFVDTMEPNADGLARALRSVALRDGFLLRYPAAHTRVLEAAEPLDVMFVSMAHLLSGRMVNGYTHHLSIHLGSEAQLRDLGVWDHPAIRPLHDAIRAGAVVIEANGEQVRLAGPRYVFNSDSVALFTPTHLTRSERRAGVIALASALGTPFDFHFDMSSRDSLYCVELLSVALPNLVMPEREVYQRPVVMPDDLILSSLRGETCLRFKGFVYGLRDRWGVGSADLLAQSIARAWKTLPE